MLSYNVLSKISNILAETRITVLLFIHYWNMLSLLFNFTVDTDYSGLVTFI